MLPTHSRLLTYRTANERLVLLFTPRFVAPNYSREVLVGISHLPSTLPHPPELFVFLPLAGSNQKPQVRDPQMPFTRASLLGDKEDGGERRVNLEQQRENVQCSAGCQAEWFALHLEPIRKQDVWHAALANLGPFFSEFSLAQPSKTSLVLPHTFLCRYRMSMHLFLISNSPVRGMQQVSKANDINYS